MPSARAESASASSIYFTVEDVDGIGVLYTKTGEYSAVLRMENPVQKYSADIDSYYEFTSLLTAIAQTLGEGYAIHKQDVFVRKRFEEQTSVTSSCPLPISVTSMDEDTRTAPAT